MLTCFLPRFQKWSIEPETCPFRSDAEDKVKGVDGDGHTTNQALSYEWFYYGEAGTLTASNARSGQPLETKNFDQPKAPLNVPAARVMASGAGTMHIIPAVPDHGSPQLTRYTRVIVDVVE